MEKNKLENVHLHLGKCLLLKSCYNYIILLHYCPNKLSRPGVWLHMMHNIRIALNVSSHLTLLLSFGSI